MSKRHLFLKEEGHFEEAQALGIKEVVVWQLMDAMEKGAARGRVVIRRGRAGPSTSGAGAR